MVAGQPRGDDRKTQGRPHVRPGTAAPRLHTKERPRLQPTPPSCLRRDCGPVTLAYALVSRSGRKDTSVGFLFPTTMLTFPEAQENTYSSADLAAYPDSRGFLERCPNSFFPSTSILK